MRWIGVGVIGALLGVISPALAEPIEVPQELQGRRNPFRSLIGSNAPADVTGADSPGSPLPARKPISVIERLEYVGIAYDEAEAIAAVSDGERTWFVRTGDLLEGAAVTAITPHKLTWKRQGRLVVKHLRREGVR